MPYFVVTVTWPRWACRNSPRQLSARRNRTWGRRRSGGCRRRKRPRGVCRESRRPVAPSGLNSRSRGGWSCGRCWLRDGLHVGFERMGCGCWERKRRGSRERQQPIPYGDNNRKATDSRKASWWMKGVGTEGRLGGGWGGARARTVWVGSGSRSMGRLRLQM